MIKLLAASAAAFITLTAAVAPGASACDEDCAYEAHEAAYERAYERGSAREEAEEGYYSSGGRRSGSASRRERAALAAQAEKSAASSSASRRAEPKPVDPAPSTESRTPRTKVAKENSSVSTESGSDRIAEDTFERRPAKAVGCKKYFASVGMTLSVPCE